MSLLLNWLATLDPNIGLQIESLAPASSDASFRRYFRIQAGSGTLIAMDAPPPQENCRPFVDIATRLADVKLNVPEPA
jgi:aminoglycoside/choline kinase family phosphotransferase